MKILLLIVLILNTSLANAATIRAAIDRNPVNMGDSFQLTLTADDTPDADPDLEPLSLDFDILNQTHSSQSSWINGQSSQKIEWIVQLMPKHTGSIVIPSIAFGSDKSQPLTVMVTQAAANPVQTDAELFLKVEATPNDPYVQGQVLYTLSFYRRVNISQARLDEPNLQDALIQKMGEDSNFNTQVNGVDYVVTERKYAIFPQKSGVFTIKPLALTAEVISQRQPSFNGFFNSPSTHMQRITSNAITLNVRPAPAAAQSKHWLPAEELQIKQEWSGDIHAMRTGEPLTRTLSIVAKGATVGVIPELNKAVADPALKNYPDQPTIKELQKADGIYAIREEKIAFIASKAGTYQLPAIDIPWFNTKTQQMQVASIPATTLQVAAGANSPVTPPPAHSQAPQQNVPNTPPALNPVNIQTSQASDNSLWLWVALFLGIGWLSTLIYFLTGKRNAKSSLVTEKSPAKPDFSQALKQACQQNDPQAAKQALLQWGLSQYGVNSLGAIAEQCDSRLRDEILQLNHLLYAPDSLGTESWQGKRLYQAFTEQNVSQKLQRTPDEALEPLFRI